MAVRHSNLFTMRTKHIVIILIAVACILLIPFIGMQFTEEVNWSISDFVVMGTLLFLTGFGINFSLQRFKTLKHRIMLCVGILIVLFIIWAELAVGIFGSPVAGS